MLQNSILQFWKQLGEKVQRDFFDKLIIITFFAFVKRGGAKKVFEKIFGAASKKMSCTVQRYGEISCKNNGYSILHRYGCISIEESRKCRALTRPGKDACNDMRQADRKGGFRREDGNYGSPFRTTEARYGSPNDRNTRNCVPCLYTAVSRVALAACLGAAKRAASTLPDRSSRTSPRPAGDPPSRSAGA